MTIKADLLATIGPMSAIERSMGRYMRGPEHALTDFEADTAGNDEPADEGLDKGKEEGLDGDQPGASEDEDGDEGEGEEDNAETDEEKAAKAAKKGEPLPKGVQRRIDRLTRRTREAEEELRELRRGNQGGSDEKPDKSAKEPEGDKKPVLTDFDTYEDWIEALTDYKADKRIEAAEANRESKASDRSFATKLAEGRKAFADWDEVVTDDVRLSGHMVDAIKETDNPAALIYYFGDNPEEADRILALSPRRQALEIGKLEDKVATPKADADKTPAKKTSSAPDPIEPVRKSGKVTKDVTEIEDVDDFIRARNKQQGITKPYM